MTGEVTSATRPKLSTRSGASRKLLERKAAERVGADDPAEPSLESVFPTDAGATALVEDHAAAQESPDVEALGVATPSTAEAQIGASTGSAIFVPVGALPAPLQAAAPTQPSQLTTWSPEDESAFQSLLARRKAAGYQRRGKDVSAQLIRPGDIKPNPNTVVAVIVGIVVERGIVTRAELVAAMTEAAFPHAKAQPADKGWCQGYVAGAIRNGFLALDGGPAAGEGREAG